MNVLGDILFGKVTGQVKQEEDKEEGGGKIWKEGRLVMEFPIMEIRTEGA